MTSTTTTGYSAEFSTDAQVDGIASYVRDGGYDEAQAEQLAAALFDALRVEVDARLPEGITWQPRTADFLVPCDALGRPTVDLPGLVAMRGVFADAWAAVEARIDGIEAEALGLVGDVDDDDQADEVDHDLMMPHDREGWA